MMTTFTDGANLLNRKSQKMHDFTIAYKVRGLYDGAFCKNRKRVKAVNYLCKLIHHRCLTMA